MILSSEVAYRSPPEEEGSAQVLGSFLSIFHFQHPFQSHDFSFSSLSGNTQTLLGKLDLADCSSGIQRLSVFGGTSFGAPRSGSAEWTQQQEVSQPAVHQQCCKATCALGEKDSLCWVKTRGMNTGT